MSEIDWSKAPEGCIGAFRPAGDYCWKPFFVLTKAASDFQGRPGFVGVSADRNEYHVFTECWTWVERAWTGEGLPPVGTVCEYLYTEAKEWRAGEVVAIRGGMAIVCDLDDDGAESVPPHGLRPLRTPEQIAAEERARAIDEMWSVYWQPEAPTAKEALGLLYDAGYRKVSP